MYRFVTDVTVSVDSIHIYDLIRSSLNYSNLFLPLEVLLSCVCGIYMTRKIHKSYLIAFLLRFDQPTVLWPAVIIFDDTRVSAGLLSGDSHFQGLPDHDGGIRRG